MNKEKEILPNHIDHKIEAKKPNNCIFYQVGVHIACNGNNDHMAHAFTVPARLVLRGQDSEGLIFEDIKTGEEVRKIPER